MENLNLLLGVLAPDEGGEEAPEATDPTNVNEEEEDIDIGDRTNSLALLMGQMITNKPANRPAEDDEDADWGRADSAAELLALNEAYTELIDSFISKVERALMQNQEEQTQVREEIAKIRDRGNTQKKKVPVLTYLPPYFKDENMMTAPLSDEARRKIAEVRYDPLMKEEKKWTPTEIQQLKRCVRAALLNIHMQPFFDRKEMLVNKIKASGADVSQHEINQMKEELECINRKISFGNNISDADLVAIVDGRKVDFAKIANIDFNGLRTADALRLKWDNELSPRWNQSAWTDAELKELKRLRENERFVSWAVLADRLGTRRTPWECFSKYKRDVQQVSKEWTTEEDEKLIELCELMAVNGNINWDKVTYYMPGRNRQQVRVRWMRTLDKNVKHGRWSEQEDVLLMCAVNRLGAQDWSKVAKAVPGRTDTQCRERWVSVLDRRVAPKEWSLAEDEKLLYLVTVFGRNQWARCAQFLPGRNGDTCRYRYTSLVNTKIRLCSAKNNIGAKAVTAVELNARWMIKRMRVNRVYNKFNTIASAMDDRLEDGEGLERLFQIVQELENDPDRKFNPKTVIDETVRQQVSEGVEEIEERHRGGNRTNQADLMDMIQLEERDLETYERRKTKMKEQKSEKRELTGDVARKGRKLRLHKEIEEPVEVAQWANELMNNKEIPEDAKRKGLTDILIKTIERHDHFEWNQEFFKLWREAGGSIATDFIEQTLTQKFDEQVETLRNGGQLSVQDSLSVNYSNTDFYNLLKKASPRLMREASEIFHRTNVGINHPDYNLYADPFPKFEMTDSLHIPLSDDVKKTDEYLKLKVLLRNILVEPAAFEHACLSEEQIGQVKKTELDVRERELEHDAIASGLVPPPHFVVQALPKLDENLLVRHSTADPTSPLPPVESLIGHNNDEGGGEMKRYYDMDEGEVIPAAARCVQQRNSSMEEELSQIFGDDEEEDEQEEVNDITQEVGGNEDIVLAEDDQPMEQDKVEKAAHEEESFVLTEDDEPKEQDKVEKEADEEPEEVEKEQNEEYKEVEKALLEEQEEADESFVLTDYDQPEEHERVEKAVHEEHEEVEKEADEEEFFALSEDEEPKEQEETNEYVLRDDDEEDEDEEIIVVDEPMDEPIFEDQGAVVADDEQEDPYLNEVRAAMEDDDDNESSRFDVESLRFTPPESREVTPQKASTSSSLNVEQGKEVAAEEDGSESSTFIEINSPEYPSTSERTPSPEPEETPKAPTNTPRKHKLTKTGWQPVGSSESEGGSPLARKKMKRN